MKYLWIISVICLFWTTSLFAGTIKLTADPWMPFNGDGKTDTGYILDMAKAVFEKAGYTVVFEVTPWSRAIEETRAGNFDGIIGADVSDAPDFIFPDIEQGHGNMVFYVKKGAAWKYDGIKSLEGIKLAVIQDYSYFDGLDSYIKSNIDNKKRIDLGFGTSPLEANVKKLLNGAVDAIVDNGDVIKYLINKQGLQGKLAIAGIEKKDQNMFIAFSPKNPKAKEFAKMMTDGTIQLRKTGALQKILSKYGLTDWK